MKNFIALTVLLLIAGISAGQEQTPDYSSPEALTELMLDLISVDIGEEPDWELFRTLFAPGARMMARIEQNSGETAIMDLDLEAFITRVGPNYAKDGFEEYSQGTSINEFNGIATVFQSFYCRNLKGTYEETGINSYSLVYKDDRWWILQVLFVNATEQSRLPSKYLNSKN